MHYILVVLSLFLRNRGLWRPASVFSMWWCDESIPHQFIQSSSFSCTAQHVENKPTPTLTCIVHDESQTTGFCKRILYHVLGFFCFFFLHFYRMLLVQNCGTLIWLSVSVLVHYLFSVVSYRRLPARIVLFVCLLYFTTGITVYCQSVLVLFTFSEVIVFLQLSIAKAYRVSFAGTFNQRKWF